jgi:hypothetical protein
LHFDRGGTAVAGRAGGHVGAALENVGDEDVGALEAHGFDDFCEELAGFSDKGLALEVFVRARGFADEHEARVDVADSEDGLGAGAGEVGALSARGDGGAELLDAGRFGGGSSGEDLRGEISIFDFRFLMSGRRFDGGRRNWPRRGCDGGGAGCGQAAERIAGAAKGGAVFAELAEGGGCEIEGFLEVVHGS